jgi:myo-inositol-1(or 4)-monophosphatase
MISGIEASIAFSKTLAALQMIYSNMKDYSRELTIAKEAAQKGAELVQKFQSEKNFDVGFKGRNDMVTDADVSVETEIKQIISDAFPDDQLLAEESSGVEKITSDRVWIIDPIDGTTNFVHGFPIYGVSICFCAKSLPTAAVIVEVNSKNLFEAVKNRGAFCNEKKISVSSIEKPAHSLVGTGFPYNDMSLTDNYLQLFKWLLFHIQDVRRPGAASYDLCCVASGCFEGFYEYALQPWDVAAAGLIVREAGGIVTDWKGGDDWLFGERIIAGNPAIHSFLLEAIQQHFSSEELTKNKRET